MRFDDYIFFVVICQRGSNHTCFFKNLIPPKFLYLVEDAIDKFYFKLFRWVKCLTSAIFLVVLRKTGKTTLFFFRLFGATFWKTLVNSSPESLSTTRNKHVGKLTYNLGTISTGSSTKNTSLHMEQKEKRYFKKIFYLWQMCIITVFD